MIRYSSIEEVNAALIELEENERTVSTDKFNSEKHSDTDKPLCRTTSSTIAANGQSILNGNEENGLHEDIGGSDTDSGSGTIDQDGHDEEELDEENHDGGVDTEDEDDDGDGPASEEEDEVHVRQKVAEVDPLEVASFEQELRAVMQARFRLLFFLLTIACASLSIVNTIYTCTHVNAPTVHCVYMKTFFVV
jgi:regulator of nonsense transcripts 2